MAGYLWGRNTSRAPQLAGFRVQSSVYGLPIPIVYGTARVAGNLIDFVPGKALPQKSQTSKWAPSVVTGYTYPNSLALALGEGTIAGIGNVWADKDTKKDFATVIQPRDLWTLKTGTIAQAALGFLSTSAPYQYIAYVAVDALPMANNVLPNFSWEVKGLHIFGGGVVDALGSDVLSDMLTDPIHGAAFPSGSLDSLTDYEDYCAAAGLFVSPAFTTLRKVSDCVDELMIATNSAVVWSDGLLKVKPYGDEALTGHGHTYTPDVNPIYDLSDTDFLPNDDGGPITVTRKNPNECYNQLFLEFENRASDYNVDVREAKNDASILSTRLIPAPKLSVPMIKDHDVARLAAQLNQQRAQFVVNQYGFKLGWIFSLLEPMDLVTLSDVGLGLDFTPVRIIEVVELEDGAGIQITAEDWPFGVAGATRYPSQAGGGHKPAQNVDPGNTVVQIADAPSQLTNGYTGIWIGASGGANWGGCEVWYSYDNATFFKLGDINAKSTFGTLTASLATNARYPAVDVAHTLKVDTTVSGETVDAVDQTVFDALQSLLWVDNEWLIYRDASLTSTSHYDITHLGRGLYGSPIQNPVASGRPFMLIPPAFDATGNLTGSVLRWANPGVGFGDTIYFKFPAVNIYGNELQSLASIASVSHTVSVDASVVGNAIPQGTVAIAADGTPTLEVDGPGWVGSYKYLTSTSAFPTDAAVRAGGTIVDGRTQSITVAPLTIGEPIFATFLPYTGLQASGIEGHNCRLKATYQALQATKTTSFASSVWTLDATQSTVPTFAVLAGEINCDPLPGFGDFTNLVAHVVVPNGCVVTDISMDFYDNSQAGSFAQFGGDRVIGGLADLLIQAISTQGIGWQTLTIGMAGFGDSTGAAFALTCTMNGPAASAGDFKMGQTYITYTMPDPTKSV